MIESGGDEELYHLDLCAGSAGFTLAAESAGSTISGCAETDPFPAALIVEKLDLDNFSALDVDFVERLMMFPHDHTNLQNTELYKNLYEAVKELSRFPARSHMKKNTKTKT